MFRNIIENDVLDEINNLLNCSRLQPEPQVSGFRKYLSISTENKEDAVVELTNSHGVQLRNNADRLSRSSSESNNDCPVISLNHLAAFKNFGDLTSKLKEMPSEWTILQITSQLDPYCINIGPKNLSQTGPSVYITKFNCGDLVDRCPPYFVNVDSSGDGTLLNPLMNLITARREAYKNWSNKKLRDYYKNTDSILQNFINEFETHWLKNWICILCGSIEDTILDNSTYSEVEKCFDEFVAKQQHKIRCSKVAIDIGYHVALNAHLMKNKDMMAALKFALNDYQNPISNTDLFNLVEHLKVLNLKNNCEIKRATKNPVILIIDNFLEIVPWEMMSSLIGQPVSRIISLHTLYALFKFYEKDISCGYKSASIDSAYCLLNPSQDLVESEKKLTKFFKSEVPWIKLQIGDAPPSSELASLIENSKVYLYCGHGSGSKFLKPTHLMKTKVMGIVLLFGCSSNLPRSLGGRTPFQNDTYTYIMNGCPCLIGCLYDVTSSDADKACIGILSQILPRVSPDSNTTMKNPIETNILKALNSGKSTCDKTWSKSSFIARGIPCKIMVNSS